MTRNMRILLFNVFDYINKKTYVTLGLYMFQKIGDQIYEQY